MTRTLLIGLLGLASYVTLPARSHAQPDVSGYALAMASHAGSSALLPSATTVLARARVMLEAQRGPLVLDLAYEHVATRSTGTGLGLTTPGVASGTDWVGAQWVIRDSDRGQWRHRFDRFALGWSGSGFDVTVGRQAISWATTLFLTPADPFVPFDPSDPFRVYRAGVDAARLRFFPGPFTEIEVVARASDTPLGHTTTLLARAQTSSGGWALGGWLGALHDEAAAAVFATGALGSTAVRTELSLREDPDGSGAVVRAALGLDRYFSPGGRDVSLVGELQYDGFGATDAAGLLQVSQSEPFQRGDMQALSRWTVAAQGSYRFHPLISVDALALAGLDEPSVLLAPGASWSATAAASVRAGIFWGVGPDTVAQGSGAPASEYGAIPAIGYLSLTWFF